MHSGYPDTPLQEGCFSSMRLRPWTSRRYASRRDGYEGEDPLWQDGGEEVFAGTGTAGITTGHKMYQNQRFENVPGSVLGKLQTGRLRF